MGFQHSSEVVCKRLYIPPEEWFAFLRGWQSLQLAVACCAFCELFVCSQKCLNFAGLKVLPSDSFLLLCAEVVSCIGSNRSVLADHFWDDCLMLSLLDVCLQGNSQVYLWLMLRWRWVLSDVLSGAVSLSSHIAEVTFAGGFRFSEVTVWLACQMFVVRQPLDRSFWQRPLLDVSDVCFWGKSVFGLLDWGGCVYHHRLSDQNCWVVVRF